MQNVALQHSQPADMFFLNATDSQKGKANPNPRASIAARQSHSKTQVLKRVQFPANNLGEGVGPTACVSVTGRLANNFYFF
jgi:hypothetical protein